MTWKPDKLDELFADEKAVSPVVGVALLIAMTVILAAVIGTVVLGLGSNPAQAPQATFTFDLGNDDTSVDVTHDGGDALPAEEITIVTNNGEKALTDDADYARGDEWTAGEEVTVADGSSITEVRVVWEDEDSDKTSTLAEYEA